MIKVGINGFGRIGRFVFRAAQSRDDIQIVGINDLCPVDYLAYMLKYDTMHGLFEGTIEADEEKNQLIVNGKAIRVTAERNPADLKGDAVGAENNLIYIFDISSQVVLFHSDKSIDAAPLVKAKMGIK